MERHSQKSKASIHPQLVLRYLQGRVQRGAKFGDDVIGVLTFDALDVAQQEVNIWCQHISWKGSNKCVHVPYIFAQKRSVHLR